MIEPVLLFVAGFLGTLIITPLVIRLAERWGGMDLPGERKVHDHPIPRLGGVAIFATFGLAALGAIGFIDRIRGSFMANQAFWLALAAGGTVVFLLGLYDDVRHASIWTKFAVQAAAAGLVIGWGGVRIQELTNPFDGKLSLGWLGVPLTVLWIVGVTNALNLIDGLDGLAGGVALISVVTIFTISFMLGGRSMVVLVTALLAGSLFGFLRYNFHPARIFLGDCGSMFLGFVLAILSVVGSNKRTAALALLIPILILGIPVFDTLFAMARRLGKRVLVEGEWRPSALVSMFSADRAHIHHTLMEVGYTHRRTVVILYGLSIVFALLALVAVVADDDRVSFALMMAGLLGFVVMKQFGRYLPFGKGPK